MKNRNPFRTIKPKKVQFVLYLHTVAIELINRMKTNEIGEIVWKKVPNVSYSSIIRILTNFIVEPPVSSNHKVLLQAIPITFSKSLHKSSTCNHEPQFPVLKRIINLIFKVWGIKRSGKSLYQNTFFLFVVGKMISNRRNYLFYSMYLILFECW